MSCPWHLNITPEQLIEDIKQEIERVERTVAEVWQPPTPEGNYTLESAGYGWHLQQ